MDRLVLKKRLASVLSQRKTTIGEEKIESSANDFAENCMKVHFRIDSFAMLDIIDLKF